MSDLSVNIIGADKLAKKIDKIVKTFPKASEKAMLDSVLYVHSQTPAYPPPPPMSKYTRTGTLGRSVTTLQGKHADALSRIEPLNGGRGVQGYVGTKLTYADSVIGEHQKRAFAGRWWRLVDVVTKSRNGIMRIWQRTLQDLIKKS